MSESDQLNSVSTWTKHREPYWNGVAKSANNAPGVGTLHRARIEDGRVVEVECHARVDEWVAFTSRNSGEQDREKCLNCGRLVEVPGVERDGFVSRVKLTEDYAPEDWSPTPLGADIATESEENDD